MSLEAVATELERLGFSSGDTGEVYSMAESNLVSSLWEIGSRREPTKFAIKMGVWINDPFLDFAEQDGAVAVTGFLTRSGASMGRNAAADWWSRLDAGNVYETLLNKGIPDLVEFANPGALLRYFHDDVVPSYEDSSKKESWLTRSLERLIVGSNPTGPERKPPINNYYLSLLYFHLRDLKRSTESASAWLDHVTKAPFGVEPERTYRHLGACGHS